MHMHFNLDRLQDGLSPIEVHTLRDVLKLGDIVSASGCIEPDSFTMRVTHIEVEESWKAVHAGVSFVPKLLPSLHQNKPSCRADNESLSTNARPSHQDSAAPHLQQHSLTRQPLCKYWVNTGRCLRGDTCDYQHVKPSQLPELRQSWVTARRRHKQELSQEAGNPHGLDAARKGQRAAIFCDWLIATFGSPNESAPCMSELRLDMVSELMKQGSGVLDIAGGRGSVSFELQTVRRIRCTLIDPRPQKVSKSQRKWLKSFATSQQRDTAAARASTDEAQSAFKPVATELSSSAAHHAMAQANVFAAEADALPDSVPAETSATEAELPSSTAHAQAFAVEAGAPHTGQQGGTVHSQQSASQDQACLPQQPNPQAEAQPRWPDLQGTLSHQLQAEFNSELWTEGDIGQQLQSCSLVLGLHPDQATDSIVDFAMQFGKPFAVVPCCVFPRQFQDRQLRNDHGKVQKVLTHTDLVQYLMQKSDGLQEYLAFEGMNQVVFRNAPVPSTV